MNIKTLIPLAAVTFLIAIFKYDSEPWEKDQLLNPPELAKIINDPQAKKPIIYSVGPEANIKGNIEILN